MFPPSQNTSFNLQALSGVAGSISIACWVVVFSPQIIQNFRRGSADGLSLEFLAIWLLGDLFNIVGAVLQGVLPTMIILAAYYTIADIVLLFQCLYYRRRSNSDGSTHQQRRPDSSHLSPATPLLDPPKDDDDDGLEGKEGKYPAWKSVLFNAVALASVCAAGAAGWYLSPPTDTTTNGGDGEVTFSPLGQVFGYLCAVLYLASRVPQILLNYRRRSCGGVSILFFMFAGVGNLTYVMSILANDPGEGPRAYWRYVAVNASWLLGSVGTLVLDMVIFAQFFMYQGDDDDDSDLEDVSDEYSESEEERAVRA